MKYTGKRNNKKINLKRDDRGLTIVEMLLYMGLMAILLVVITDMFVAIVNIKQESETVSLVEQEGRFILARISYDVNRADSITTPGNPGDSSTSLVISTEGSSTTYQRSGTTLQVTNTNGTGDLNSNRTQITSFDVKKLGSSNKPTVKVTFDIESIDETRNFSITIGVRR